MTKILICSNGLARYNWIMRLKRAGFNYFVPYRDTRGCGLMYGMTDWNYVYVDGGLYM